MVKASANIDWNDIDFDDQFLSGISVDTVIFGFNNRQLSVLLLRYQNTNSFALPGGFIFKDENGNDAAQRVLEDRTGLSNIFLEQFHTFAEKDRSDSSFLKAIMEARGLKPTSDHFLLRRFISIGFYALVDFTKVNPAVDQLSDECKWHDLKSLPQLIQDHRYIIEKALFTLRKDLDKKLIGFNLLPDMFTMGELQALYETVLEKDFLRSSFQRTMLGLSILEKVSKKTGVAHKAPYLYKFVNR